MPGNKANKESQIQILKMENKNYRQKYLNWKKKFRSLKKNWG